ncbi:metal transporter, ZIP family [Lachnospiraceae bacterium KM106-2]|nr:metal transporter, ZIP family [Lachnospiraceae bacterium KM106-2]
MKTAIGILIPLVGTLLGSASVFFLRNKISKTTEKVLNGFASGVMIAASVWSLLLPAIEASRSYGRLAFVPSIIGITAGIAFLILVEKISKRWEDKMLLLAVTIHNIPEGMAVGVGFAGAISGNTTITMVGAFTLALGIGIQNIPEGAIISLPLKLQGRSKSRAFLIGTLSGIVEPIASILTILLTSYIVMILPYLLSFAAGAMLYVVTDELLLETADNKNSHIGAISFALGFMVMMSLDVALG